MGILAKTIVISDGEYGLPTVYLAGEDVPDEVIDMITNPKVLRAPDVDPDEDEDPDVDPDEDEDPDVDPDEDEDPDDEDVPEPPRAGPGSGTAAWREYADRIGVTGLPEDAKKSDIIAAVDTR